MDLIQTYKRAWKYKHSGELPDLEKLTGNSDLNSLSFSSLSRLSETTKTHLSRLKTELEQVELLDRVICEMLSSYTTNVDEHESESRISETSHLRGDTGKNAHLQDKQQIKVISDVNIDGNRKNQIKPPKPARNSKPLQHLETDLDSESVPPYENVRVDFKTSWLDRAVGSSNQLLSDDDDDDDSDSTENNSEIHFQDKNKTNIKPIEDKEHNSQVVKRLPRFTNPDSVNQFNMLDSPTSENTDTKLSENITTDIPKYPPKKEDNEHASVLDKIKAMERRSSERTPSTSSNKGIQRVSSERPTIPPRPRLSKPKAPPHHFGEKQSPDDIPSLPPRSYHEPDIAPSFKRKEGSHSTDRFSDNTNVPPQSHGDNKSEQSDYTNQETSNQDYVHLRHTNKNKQQDDTTGNKTTLTEETRHFVRTPEKHGQYGELDSAFIDDPNTDDMKSKGTNLRSSVPDVKHVVGQHFRKLSDGTQLDNIEVTGQKEVIATDNSDDVNKTPAKPKRTMMEQIRDIDKNNATSGTFSPGSRTKSNYFNVSINVLVTQQDSKIEVSDSESSSDENEDENKVDSSNTSESSRINSEAESKTVSSFKYPNIHHDRTNDLKNVHKTTSLPVDGPTNNRLDVRDGVDLDRMKKLSGASIECKHFRVIYFSIFFFIFCQWLNLSLIVVSLH